MVAVQVGEGAAAAHGNPLPTEIVILGAEVAAHILFVQRIDVHGGAIPPHFDLYPVVAGICGRAVLI